MKYEKFLNAGPSDLGRPNRPLSFKCLKKNFKIFVELNDNLPKGDSALDLFHAKLPFIYQI